MSQQSAKELYSLIDRFNDLITTLEADLVPPHKQQHIEDDLADSLLTTGVALFQAREPFNFHSKPSQQATALFTKVRFMLGNENIRRRDNKDAFRRPNDQKIKRFLDFLCDTMWMDCTMLLRKDLRRIDSNDPKEQKLPEDVIERILDGLRAKYPLGLEKVNLSSIDDIADMYCPWPRRLDCQLGHTQSEQDDMFAGRVALTCPQYARVRAEKRVIHQHQCGKILGLQLKWRRCRFPTEECTGHFESDEE